MAIMNYIPRSVQPASEALWAGVGKGSGTSLGSLFKMGVASANVLDIRTRHDGATGTDARILYARLHQYGTGGGDAVRAYAFANNAAAATTGTLNGLHATLSIATSSAISGAGSAIRATLEAASASRTLGGTLSALNVDSNIGSSNTVPATSSFIRVTNTGSVALNNLLNVPVVASGGMLAAHVTDAITHSIRICSADGTKYYLMATTTVSNRTGGG
jgi:hypothetical protein